MDNLFQYKYVDFCIMCKLDIILLEKTFKRVFVYKIRSKKI